MKYNWTAVGVGFFVTLILGLLFPFIGLGLIAPIIGGIVAGYITKGTYMDGALNGGNGAGFAGFIAVLIIVFVFGGNSGSLTGVSVNSGGLLLATFLTAIVVGIINTILGAIGGAVGILIKGNKEPGTTE